MKRKATYFRRSRAGFGVHLVNDISRPALDIVIFHRTIPTASYHVYFIAIGNDLLAKVLTVSVSGGGRDAIRDGCTQGHDTEPYAVCKPPGRSYVQHRVVGLKNRAWYGETWFFLPKCSQNPWSILDMMKNRTYWPWTIDTEHANKR